MLEFITVGIAAVFILISTIQLGFAMWQYHSLDSALQLTGRYLSVRGRGCTQNSNTCSVTVGTIAKQLVAYTNGIPAQLLTVNLVPPGGSTTTCSPLSSCFSNTTVWPPSPYNGPGQIFVITGTCQWNPAVGMVWPGTKPGIFPTYALGASTAAEIMF